MKSYNPKNTWRVGREGQAMAEGNKNNWTLKRQPTWPEDPLHTWTHTPSHVWEKCFPLLSFLSQWKTTLPFKVWSSSTFSLHYQYISRGKVLIGGRMVKWSARPTGNLGVLGLSFALATLLDLFSVVLNSDPWPRL